MRRSNHQPLAESRLHARTVVYLEREEARVSNELIARRNEMVRLEERYATIEARLALLRRAENGEIP